MRILIKSAKVVDSQSSFNNQIVDLLIENGKIQSIKKNISQEDDMKIVVENNLHICPSFLDLKANFRDPGYEIKEDINTGIQCALKGGYSDVLLMPTNKPTTDSKVEVNYIKNHSKSRLVNIHPAGSITKNNLGNELCEMYDMSKEGAIAFTDDKNSIQKAGILKLALEYNKFHNGLVINHPNDKSISNDGSMNEGPTSTNLGLKGIPSISEELMLARDIELAEYTNSKIHISCISTKKSVELIKEAKAKGIKISCDVSINNLILDDSNCNGFDTNFKLLPPLRTNSDVSALIEGINNGTIDAICSDHSPEDIENKQAEFDNAAFGAIGLQTVFPLLCTLKDKISLETIIDKLSVQPRKILNLPIYSITENDAAKICLFNPDKNWTFQLSDIVSKSKNSPYINYNMGGEIIGVINGLESNL
jgi:dihydroorotase